MTIQLQQIIEDEMVSGIDNILIPTYKHSIPAIMKNHVNLDTILRE